MCELVSVIVTTYKRPSDVVIRSLKSICRQTYENIEIIVVDDSPASFGERENVKRAIVELDDSRIKYLQNDTNVGACASRNRGIEDSHGTYIMYVDDDDELVAECIEKRLTKFSSNTVGLVYSDAYRVYEKNNVTEKTNQAKHRGMVFDQLIKQNFIYAFPIFRRECLTECGMFDTSMPAAQDYELWLRISRKYEIDYVDEPLSVVHIHEGERISTGYGNKVIGLTRINDMYYDYLSTHKDAYYCRVMALAYYLALSHDVKKWLPCIAKGICLKPLALKQNMKELLKSFRGLLT